MPAAGRSGDERPPPLPRAPTPRRPHRSSNASRQTASSSSVRSCCQQTVPRGPRARRDRHPRTVRQLDAPRDADRLVEVNYTTFDNAGRRDGNRDGGSDERDPAPRREAHRSAALAAGERVAGPDPPGVRAPSAMPLSLGVVEGYGPSVREFPDQPLEQLLPCFRPRPPNCVRGKQPGQQVRATPCTSGRIAWPSRPTRLACSPRR
jgi:hypothetical protein